MEMKDFSLDFFSLKGKIAIVTGGSTGLGQACALAFAKAGADILITAHNSGWDESRALIEAEGRKVSFIQLDLAEDDAPARVMDACLSTYGKVDILLNNAGTIRRAPVTEFTLEDWDTVVDLNLRSMFLLSQLAAREMVKQKSGKIINIASMLSYQGGKNVPAYTASKHGVAGLTKSFASDLGEHNVQVNAIAPGYMLTKNTAALQADKVRFAEISSRIPAGRWGSPYDLMGSAVFLASAASDYMTGHIMAVDGGWLVR